MLAEIETSILEQLEPVRKALQPSGVLVRGLPDETTRMMQENQGDIIVFCTGGTESKVSLEINILLPKRIGNERACYPITELVRARLFKFIPQGAAGALTNLVWRLMQQDNKWLIKMTYDCAVSPYMFGVDDDTLPGIQQITMMFSYPTAPAFSVGSATFPSLL